MSESEKKVYTMSEFKELAETKNKCVLLINNNVYDVTAFLDEHPGGEEVLKEQNGRDASDAFEDVGHSSDAREQMKKYEIGQIHSKDAKPTVQARPLIANSNSNNDNASGSFKKLLIPILVVVIAIIYFRLTAQTNSNSN